MARTSIPSLSLALLLASCATDARRVDSTPAVGCTLRMVDVAAPSPENRAIDDAAGIDSRADAEAGPRMRKVQVELLHLPYVAQSESTTLVVTVGGERLDALGSNMLDRVDGLLDSPLPSDGWIVVALENRGQQREVVRIPASRCVWAEPS